MPFFRLVACLWIVSFAQLSATDQRNFNEGSLIPDEGYCDQPYIVITHDGNWLCTLTTGAGQEGANGQHVVSTISRDQGRTWSPLVDIEPANGPAASWVIPVLASGGRVYALYDYNGDGAVVPDLKDFPPPRRADMLGWYVFKYSDDNGRTWSKQRHRLPLPIAPVDRNNEWQGRVQMFWGIDKPTVVNGDVVFGFTRLGHYLSDNGEGWFYRSDNMLTEQDPDKIRWRLLPDGEHGVRNESLGSVQEEFNVVPLANGDLFCIFRTRLGYAAQSYSRDGGRTWSEAELATYSPGGPKIKTPRACPMVWRTSNGNYLLWYHLNSPYSGTPNIPLRNRNIAWLAGGTERNGRIVWSQPEPVCYVPERSKGISYPDLIETDGRFFISATNKTEARVIEVDRGLLDGLWHQEKTHTVASRGLALDLDSAALARGTAAMPRLSDLGGADGGFALELWLQAGEMSSGQVLLDSRVQPDGTGILVTTTVERTLRLEMSDGKNRTVWDGDSDLLRVGAHQHIVFNVDVAPRLITVVADGRVCDGGENHGRAFGYTRFGDGVARPLRTDIRNVSGGADLKLAPNFAGKLEHLRIYTRYLTTSEIIGNFHAGL